jgi:hypothetical protein
MAHTFERCTSIASESHRSNSIRSTLRPSESWSHSSYLRFTLLVGENGSAKMFLENPARMLEALFEK